MRVRTGLLTALLCLAPATGEAGTLTTISGRTMELGPARLSVSPDFVDLRVEAVDEDGFRWTLQARLTAATLAARSMNLLLQKTGNDPDTAGVMTGSGDDIKLATDGFAKIELGGGTIGIDVESSDADVASKGESSLEVECIPPQGETPDGQDGWFTTDFCKPLRSLWPNGRPPVSRGVPGEDNFGAMLVGLTASLIEGEVTKATNEYDSCTGPRETVTLSGVQVHAGAQLGREVVLQELGGPIPGGDYFFRSDETRFTPGKRYLVLLVDDSGWRWFETPVVLSNALMIENIQGKDVLITQDGWLVYGFDEVGWVPGAYVMDPNLEISTPFAAPAIQPDIDPDFIEWALTPEEAVQEFVDFAAANEIPIEGTFHLEPDPGRTWRSESTSCEESKACSCAASGPESALATLALAAWFATRKRAWVRALSAIRGRS